MNIVQYVAKICHRLHVKCSAVYGANNSTVYCVYVLLTKPVKMLAMTEALAIPIFRKKMGAIIIPGMIANMITVLVHLKATSLTIPVSIYFSCTVVCVFLGTEEK